MTSKSGRIPRTIHPAVRKGAHFPFNISAVCWVDLLGYGSMVASSGYNPTNKIAIQATQRLKQFHQNVALKSMRHFPTLVMNDGAVAYRDLSFRNKSVTYDFIRRCWDLFNAIQTSEKIDSFPGARMVIASGFRIRGRRSGLDATAGQFASLLRRHREGLVTTDQALHEAVRIHPVFDVVPQLQANFAFTKAYVAEQSGTDGGLKGPACFVESSFLTMCFRVGFLSEIKSDGAIRDFL